MHGGCAAPGLSADSGRHQLAPWQRSSCGEIRSCCLIGTSRAQPGLALFSLEYPGPTWLQAFGGNASAGLTEQGSKLQRCEAFVQQVHRLVLLLWI